MAVRMTHPDLPGQEYWAVREQVPHLRATGWQEAEGHEGQGETWPVEAQRFEGQPVASLRHPDVTDEITVAESAVPFHQSRGWQRIDDEPEAEDAGGPMAEASDDSRTVEDLKAEIRALNETRDPDDRLPVSGTKAELLARLNEAQAQTSQAPETPADEEGV